MNKMILFGLMMFVIVSAASASYPLSQSRNRENTTRMEIQQLQDMAAARDLVTQSMTQECNASLKMAREKTANTAIQGMSVLVILAFILGRASKRKE